MVMDRSITRVTERETHRKQLGDLAMAGQFRETTANAVERRRDEIEVVHLSALERLTREGAEDFQRALQERFEVATTHAIVAFTQLAIALDQHLLGGVAEDLADSAIAQERGEIVCVRPHSHVLKVDHVKLLIKEMEILAMKIAVTKNVRMRGSFFGQLSKRINETLADCTRGFHQLL